jgi:hypothetical protein
MTKKNAQEKEFTKKHGDGERAMEDADRHESSRADAVPAAEDGGHERSHAAHLDDAHKHTKSEGNLEHGKEQGELRQPLPIQQHLQQRISGRHK